MRSHVTGASVILYNKESNIIIILHNSQCITSPIVYSTCSPEVLNKLDI